MAETAACRPLIFIVSGPPGSGKTTLARRLGATLQLPVLAKDDLKEVLYETVGAPDVESSMRLGRASFALLALMAERLASAGVAMVLEAPFYRDWLSAWVAPLRNFGRVAMVQCGGNQDVILRRYHERAERGERHPGHRDTEALDRLRTSLAEGLYDLPRLDLPVLRVDTTIGSAYEPDFDAIVAFCRQQSGVETCATDTADSRLQMT